MIFEGDELVMYKKDGKMYSGGFTVNSIMLQHGISPMTRVRSGGSGSKTGGGILNDSFAHLAIPAGLYYFDTGLLGQSGGKNPDVKEKGYVDDDMHKKLMELAGNVDSDAEVDVDRDVDRDVDSDIDSDSDIEVDSDDDSDANNDSDDDANVDNKPKIVVGSSSSGGKKHKKTKKQRFAKKGRKTRKT